ncbi:MAG: thioesterase family protein [Pseudomonadota bacterium]
MRDTLQVGLEGECSYLIGADRTVPALLPDADEFAQMPAVFATGYMVGLLELTCIKTLNPHLDWPREQSVGTHVDVSHVAATPVGLTVTVKVKLIEKDGRKLVFAVQAHDGVDLITQGRHERFVIDKAKFDQKMQAKAAKAQ